MKLLFRVADYVNLSIYTVKDARRAIRIMQCTQSKEVPDFVDDNKYEFLAKHANDILLNISGFQFSEKLIGTCISNLAVFAYEEKGSDRTVFKDAYCKVFSNVTENYVVGCKSPEKIKEFALGLRKSAKNQAEEVLKEAGLWGKTIDKEMVGGYIPQMDKVRQAFTVLSNKPIAWVSGGFLDESDKYVRCWPQEKQLQLLLDEPEMYAIADVEFHGLW